MIDDDGKPAADLEFDVSVVLGNRESSIVVSPLAAARVRTDAAGVAKVAWAPRDDLQFVWPAIWSDDGKWMSSTAATSRKALDAEVATKAAGDRTRDRAAGRRSERHSDQWVTALAPGVHSIW